MKRKTTNVACHLICKKHIYSVKFTDVFFIIVYLLKIIINIIKANTIIVSTIKLNKSNFIISNKIYSIIAPPPCSQHKLWIWWQTSSAILLFMIDSISYILLKINTFYKKKFSPSFLIPILYIYFPFPLPVIKSLLYKFIALGNASSLIFV